MGNGVVVFFNRMPGKWLCDYGVEPDEELLHPTTQRLKSVPWKYWFSCVFVLASVKLAVEDPVYAVIAMAACWLLAEMAVADAKYMIVPDQLIIALAVAGIGFVPHHRNGYFEGIWGCLIGAGIMLVIGLIGKAIYRKNALGGGDIKLFGALGLCVGKEGILAVFVMSTFISAAHLGWLTLRKAAEPKEQRPLVPYIAISAAIYIVILHQM